MTPKRIVISINAAWNIANFRLGLIRGLRDAGHEVVAVAPDDAARARIEAEGIPFHAIAMDKKGLSPVRDMALFWGYWRLLRRLRADIFLGYTAKPNV